VSLNEISIWGMAQAKGDFAGLSKWKL